MMSSMYTRGKTHMADNYILAEYSPHVTRTLGTGLLYFAAHNQTRCETLDQ